MPRKLLLLGLLFSFLPLAGQKVEDLGLSLEQLENKLFRLVNEERSGRGLAQLEPDPRLRAMARAHSQKMLREKTLAHDFAGYENLAQRAVGAGLYFSALGENVASSDTFVMRFYHKQLMASPSHRENLLDGRFRQLGIGIALRGGQYYVTQEFALLFTPVAAADMELGMERALEARQGRMLLPAPLAAELKEDCRRQALMFLQDRSPQEITDAMGVAAVHNFSFVDRGEGHGRMFAACQGNRPLYWALGAAFGRTPENPGGIYTLTLIVFPDLRDELKVYDSLEGVILKAVNGIRLLSRSPGLEGAAKRVSMMYYSSLASPDPAQFKECKLILAYQTLSLAAIPDDITQSIAAAPKIRSAGIHVLYPLLQGLMGNYFIVAILAD
jgi:hypothetical protein